jgi:hypothetical protein
MTTLMSGAGQMVRALLISGLLLQALHVSASATTPQGGDCRDLRRACEMKDELGEGDENCVKFGHSCSPSTPHVNCEWLRDACMYREELGIEGRNHCGRYRENCHEGTIKPEKQQ